MLYMMITLLVIIAYISVTVCDAYSPRGTSVIAGRPSPKMRKKKSDKKNWSCPKGWEQFQDYCIFLRKENATWSEAYRYCRSVGADLATIENATKNINLKTYLDVEGYRKTEVYVGGSDIYAEGVWVWEATGHPLTFTDWGPREPSSMHGEDCMAISWDVWRDKGCEIKRPSVCEMPAKHPQHVVIG